MPRNRASFFRVLLTLALIYAIQFQAEAAAPVHLDREGEEWAAKTLRSMSIEEKIGQMIMPWAHFEFMNTDNANYLALLEEMRKYHIGGFGVTVFTDGPTLLKSGPLEAATLTNRLQADSKYPLLFAADFERGLSMRLNGSTPFPAAMTFGAAGDTGLARQFGSISALEARAIGIHWNWFPDADVNSNPANPIINTRSFGEDPALVSAMVSAYIAGAHSAGLLTTVKHFPGHGDTATDSHLALASTNATRERLDALELVPFKQAIADGVDSVMVGHITVPALEPDPSRPASISGNIIDKLLKQQMGFHGIVVTDALDMGALMSVFPGSIEEVSAAAAVQAVLAGSDMIIIPADLNGAYNGLLSAVKEGVLNSSRIDASVLKILRMKASVGLHRNRFVDMAAVTRDIAKPDNVAMAQTVADRAITLVSDTHRLLPLSASATRSVTGPPSKIVTVVFTDDARSSEGGHAFANQLRQRVADAAVYYVDDANLASISDDVLQQVKDADTVIAIAESFPAPRRTTNGHASGSAGLERGAGQLLAEVVKVGGSKAIVVAFGSPYSGSDIAAANGEAPSAYLCTFSNTPTAASSLVRALFGEIDIHGRLPITIPNIGNRGAGLDLVARPQTQRFP